VIARVLVALDNSSRTEGVFDAACEIAGRFVARLHPLRVVAVSPEFPAAAAGSRADPLSTFLVKMAVDALQQLEVRSPGVSLQAPIVRTGEAWRVILEVGDEFDADLIVIGSHGYKGLDRLLGTTAANVVNMAHRNVLVVHTRPAAPRETVRVGP
jgi:nucleotide-binding universal stress UspA family protein